MPSWSTGVPTGSLWPRCVPSPAPSICRHAGIVWRSLRLLVQPARRPTCCWYGLNACVALWLRTSCWAFRTWGSWASPTSACTGPASVRTRVKTGTGAYSNWGRLDNLCPPSRPQGCVADAGADQHARGALLTSSHRRRATGVRRFRRRGGAPLRPGQQLLGQLRLPRPPGEGVGGVERGEHGPVLDVAERRRSTQRC